MILFYVLIFAIIAVPMLVVLPALWNKRNINIVDHDSKNVAIAKQRIAEIEQNFADGDEGGLEEAKLELQATLLEDLKKPTSNPTRVASKGWGICIIVFAPLLSLGIYSYLGHPQFISGERFTKTVNTQNDTPDIDQLLVRLEAKLTDNPENTQGWELAARTYMSLGKYNKAQAAYKKLNSLVPNNSNLLTAWADATIMATGNVYTPAAQERVELALEMEPNHINALWIASLGSESHGDHNKALTLLNTLLPLISDDQSSVDQINEMINRNRNHIAGGGEQRLTASTLPKRTPEQDDGRQILVNVVLEAKGFDGINPGYTVFVFAKAVNGPPLPLAVSKHKVEDLPLKIVLTEKMAMAPNMTIGVFDEVAVQARISKSGDPIQQSGDWISERFIVNSENQAPVVQLVIDKLVE